LRILVVIVLVGILASLGSGLYYLVRDKGDSGRMVRALTVRISLSVMLFLLLLAAWFAGLIRPHGL
jgi:hypothetical protein